MDTSRECIETRREIRRRRFKKMNGDTCGGETARDYEDGGEKINEQQMRIGCREIEKEEMDACIKNHLYL